MALLDENVHINMLSSADRITGWWPGHQAPRQTSHGTGLITRYILFAHLAPHPTQSLMVLLAAFRDKLLTSPWVPDCKSL